MESDYQQISNLINSIALMSIVTLKQLKAIKKFYCWQRSICPPCSPHHTTQSGVSSVLKLLLCNIYQGWKIISLKHSAFYKFTHYMVLVSILLFTNIYNVDKIKRNCIAIFMTPFLCKLPQWSLPRSVIPAPVLWICSYFTSQAFTLADTAAGTWVVWPVTMYGTWDPTLSICWQLTW